VATEQGRAEILGVVPNVPEMPPLQEDNYKVEATVNGKSIVYDPKIIKDHP
jgi:hypothetical protein